MTIEHQEIWQKTTVITWNQLLLDSFAKLLGYQLISREGTHQQQAEELFFAPFVLVSHGTEREPIFNYANQTALALWELSWEEFIQTPSRATVETTNQEDREQLLKQAREQGYIHNYSGIRISKTGKRFAIENVILWNLIDRNNNYCGQAATFDRWNFDF